MALNNEELEQAKRDWPWLYDDSGVLIEKKVLAEIHDYGMLMDHASEVYWHITNGAMSDANYAATAVIGVYENELERMFEIIAYEAVKDAFASQEDGESNDDILGRLHPTGPAERAVARSGPDADPVP